VQKLHLLGPLSLFGQRLSPRKQNASATLFGASDGREPIFAISVALFGLKNGLVLADSTGCSSAWAVSRSYLAFIVPGILEVLRSENAEGDGKKCDRD